MPKIKVTGKTIRTTNRERLFCVVLLFKGWKVITVLESGLPFLIGFITLSITKPVISEDLSLFIIKIEIKQWLTLNASP